MRSLLDRLVPGRPVPWCMRRFLRRGLHPVHQQPRQLGLYGGWKSVKLQQLRLDLQVRLLGKHLRINDVQYWTIFLGS